MMTDEHVHQIERRVAQTTTARGNLQCEPDDVWPALRDRRALLEEVKRLRSALRRCAACAGIPDPSEACRAVIGIVAGELE